MRREGVVILVASMWACSGGGADSPDASNGSEADAASTADASGADASGADASGTDASGTDASGTDAATDASTDAMPAPACPPPDGDGLTPGWLEGIALADPDDPPVLSLIAIAAAPDCSFAVVAATGPAPTALRRGQPGQPGQLTVAGESWFVARFTAGGALEWATAIGPRQQDNDLTDGAIHFMPDGSLAVVRARRGLTGNENVLARVSADGVLLADPTVVPGWVVLPIADGGAYVSRELVLERRDASGQVVWSRSADSQPKSIAELADGRVLHAGEFLGGDVVFNAGQPDEVTLSSQRFGCSFALQRPDGSLEWARLIDAEGPNVPFCGAAAAGDSLRAWLNYPSDDTTVYRLYHGDGTFEETSIAQGLIVRYDDAGEPLWHRAISHGFETDQFSIERGSFSIDADSGTVTVGGLTEGTVSFETGNPPPGGSISITSASYQAWFARYTADGALLGPVQLSSAAPETSTLTAAATRPGGSVIVGGTFSGTLGFGPFQIIWPASGPGFLAEAH